MFKKEIGDISESMILTAPISLQLFKLSLFIQETCHLGKEVQSKLEYLSREGKDRKYHQNNSHNELATEEKGSEVCTCTCVDIQ